MPKRRPPRQALPSPALAFDPSAPLCQASITPSSAASCGACCGMYNIANVSRRHARAVLLDRTRQFATDCDPTDPTTLLRFRQQREAHERQAFSDALRNCPFLGYLDGDAPHSRVGCLLHPSRHHGVDARSCGAYDSGVTCDSFHCAPNALLSPDEKTLVASSCAGDAYLYGLIVNDLPLLRELLRWVGEHARAPLPDLLNRRKFIRACRDFFRLKADWPWRDPELMMVGMFIPDPALALTPLDLGGIDYEALGCPPSRFDLILRQLTTSLDDEDDLREAESLIWARLYAALNAAR
jgi:hypothetical protein